MKQKHTMKKNDDYSKESNNVALWNIVFKKHQVAGIRVARQQPSNVFTNDIQ
jgi:hypothetical protein